MRQKLLLITGGAFVLLAVSVYGLRALLSGDHEPTIAELVDTAENAPEHAERERAAVELGNRGLKALPHLRALAQQSDSKAVRAAALYGLGMQWDFDSMDVLLNAMEDESPVVRSRAAGAVARMLSRDRRFQAHGPETDRARIVGFYRTDWEQLRNAPYFDTYKDEVKRTD